MSYSFTNGFNVSTPIGGELNGQYIKFDKLPNSIKTLLLNPKYVVLVREKQIPNTPGGGRTSGTLWHNKKILGFTVEDAIRDKKISLKTAIPDTIKDASKFNGIPSNVYNIILSPSTSKSFIRKSFYDGKGMRISSKSDPSGDNIYEADVYVSDNFATDRKTLAFDGVFIHQGKSEVSSAGCIIFSRTKNLDGTLIEDIPAVQDLNKYLQTKYLIGKGKTQQFAVITLSDFPEPEKIKTAVAIYDSNTNQPVQGPKITTLTRSKIIKP